MKSSNLGYPRIGENREWKKALEGYWAGKITEPEFLVQMEQIRLSHLQKQKDAGIDLIPVGDFTFYDHMLDLAMMFGFVPKRYEYEGGAVPLSTYFAMARGSDRAVACEMTKWFNTNYHYIVPELGDRKPTLTENKPLQAYREAKEKLGIDGKPVIVGPYTFLKLSKGFGPKELPALILQIVPLYIQVLQELTAEGVQWVQIDEPILVTSVTKDEMRTVLYIYKQLNEAVPKLRIMLQTYFDAVEHYEDVVNLPVAGVGLDFVHGLEGNLQAVKEHGFPTDKVLGAGVIDGRNIWRSDLSVKRELVETLKSIVPKESLWLQPSSSLLHVPVTVRYENELNPTVKEVLAFADEKIVEIVSLAENVVNGGEEPFAQSKTALARLNQSADRNRKEIQEAAAAFISQDVQRSSSFEQRQEIQKAWNLPPLPTTTIGSFPQTLEVRQARRKWRQGELTTEEYDQFIQKEIRKWIEIQEDIGLDVFVHGEFERTDMVEFFGEKLGGFAFTKNGWVQSYGSRCVKPPVIYGDVQFLQPMTVKESVFAQSLTNKPVKGMITGPVTILNWSFVRDDLPRSHVAFQIALALRNEVEALETAGIKMIQVDEPALREGLPMKKSAWDDYLQWAIKAFRVTTYSVADMTQIHTHMCYCEFHDFIGAIDQLDADVISIETSRSHGELVSAFHHNAYHKGIGLGVYDIHSPRVPSCEEIKEVIEHGLKALEKDQFWINPDCGLKTRGMKETVRSLANMVTATHIVRERLAVKS
ncbi:5-methyltetrahydropteroyltriglutamate--homocysteine S-methyltransferase [Neobacillus mesonae]|uniref:5-methyltetrahydropteroyltriglutamate--homocysteine methyltransferase n=1 Tax=Neobacillus mesonae TaxID=1193713 RepID=A0A3Q9R131_9BACI|nr:5-methyltetrahydropteroyltriglutamate--homocysteine S-methyltransferase [Neobacillus mesonae]AZU63895.1 5-methyltetrahydropteroyltriglutamate--homocysteine S-methyltransferase [Neobacillus mesonae]